MRLVAFAIGVVVAMAHVGHADPAPVDVAAQPGDERCAAEAARLRSHLTAAARATRRWNVGWSLGFGAAALGQGVLLAAEVNPLGPYDAASRDTLYVGAAKATLALATRLVMPLGVDLPPEQDDRCAELQALRRELSVIATKERRTFWLTHLGGAALNLAGAGVLWWRHSFEAGAVSFAISYPVGVLSAYTLPRASWRRWRVESGSWSVAVVPGRDRTDVVVGGTF